MGLLFDASEEGPPSFASARNLRQKARAAGMHPDHWYAVEYEHRLPPGRVVDSAPARLPLARQVGRSAPRKY